ncbi:hypothetical protein G9A89_021551 [Geosiphon pyriformis]|nr:hypothetical protein G9A89_021551 [Geosiphon pyriformis]
MHPVNLQAAIMNARDFETTELEANHVHAVNLGNGNHSQNQSHPVSSLTNQHFISTKLPTYNAANISNPNNTAIILTFSLSAFSINLSTAVPTYLSAATKINTTKLEIVNSSPSTDPQFCKPVIRILTTEFRHQVWPKPECTTLFKSSGYPRKPTVTNDKSLVAIFPFKLEETIPVPLFSGAALDTKSITAMYTDTKVDGHAIKLILDSRSADNGATKTPISEIDDFPSEVNGIITLIKVLVIEAIQYQALIGNNWLVKANVVLDWNTQKLQLSQNGQHTQVPTKCGHFKILTPTTPFIELEEEEKKPIWEAYQVSWANEDHNELPPILLWDEPEKRKQKEELT